MRAAGLRVSAVLRKLSAHGIRFISTSVYCIDGTTYTTQTPTFFFRFLSTDGDCNEEIYADEVIEDETRESETFEVSRSAREVRPAELTQRTF